MMMKSSLIAIIFIITLSLLLHTTTAVDYHLSKLYIDMEGTSNLDRANAVIAQLRDDLVVDKECYSAWSWLGLDKQYKNLVLYGAHAPGQGCTVTQITTAFQNITGATFGSYSDNELYPTTCFNTAADTGEVDTENPFKCGGTCDAVYCNVGDACNTRLDCLGFLVCKKKVCQNGAAQFFAPMGIFAIVVVTFIMMMF